MRLTRAQLLKGAAALVVLRKLPALPEAAPTVADGMVWHGVTAQPLTPRLGWRIVQMATEDAEIWQLTYKTPDGEFSRHSFGVTQTLSHAQVYGYPGMVIDSEKAKVEAIARAQGGVWHEAA